MCGCIGIGIYILILVPVLALVVGGGVSIGSGAFSCFTIADHAEVRLLWYPGAR